jgi:hypothetical protein
MNKTQGHDGLVERNKDGNSSLPPTEGNKVFWLYVQLQSPTLDCAGV